MDFGQHRQLEGVVVETVEELESNLDLSRVGRRRTDQVGNAPQPFENHGLPARAVGARQRRRKVFLKRHRRIANR